MKLFRCLVCGGELSPDGNFYKCSSCNSVFKEDDFTVNDAIDAIKQVFDEKQQQEIENARKNLFIELNKEYLSKTEIKKYADIIKSYYAEDIFGNFFSNACSDNIPALSEFLSKTDFTKINPSLTRIIFEFLLKSPYLFVKDIPTIFADLIDRIYKRTSLEWRAFYPAYVDMMRKIDTGFFDTKTSRDLFVAYSSKDQKEVIKLVNTLESQGLRCFVAFRNLQHGSGAIENYEKDLQTAMDNSRIFLFVSSTNSRNINCDALSVEMEYITACDEKNFPPEYRFADYKKVPDTYKKPRVEYILEDYNGENFAGESRTNKFFAGQERVYTKEDLIDRIITIRNSAKEIVKTPEKEIKILSTDEKLQKNVNTFLANGNYEKATQSIEIALKQDRYSEFVNNLYLDMAEIYLKNNDTTTAQKIVETVELNIPEIARVYILKLLLKLKFNSADDLILSPVDLKEYPEFSTAKKYATGNYQQELNTYEMTVLEKFLESGKREREKNNFDEAIKIFKKCNGYKNSDSEIFETLYQKGLYYKTKDKQKAIEIFKKIDYKDSKDQIYDIYYNNAKKYLENKEYEKALNEFNLCIDYKDTKEQIDNVYYAHAKEYLSEKDYKNAIQQFLNCIDYKDTKEQIADIYYTLATDFLCKNEYEKAIEQFNLCIDYKDSRQQIENCYITNYNNALYLKENQQYTEAIKVFDRFVDYGDTKEQIEDCYENIYQIANSYFVNADYTNAIEYFKDCINHKDSKELIKECYYQKAMEYYNNSQYDDAEKYFLLVPDYKDSNAYANKRKEVYTQANNFYKLKNYKQALKLFNTIIAYKDSQTLAKKCISAIEWQKRKHKVTAISVTLVIIAIICLIVVNYISVQNAKKFKTESISSEECSITGLPDNYDADIIIPDKISGKTVTAISSKAFYNCIDITSVTIPDTVKSIGEYAFANCTNLENIYIGNNIIGIGDNAFTGCNNLKYNEYKNGYYLGNTNNLYCVLIKTTSTDFEKFEINSNTRLINNYTFNNCTKLKKVYFEGSDEQFCKINIGTNNTYLTNDKIYYYSENNPQKDGKFWHYNESGKIELWNLYSISYNLDGGEFTEDYPTEYSIFGHNIKLVSPVKIGYEFTGWTGSNGNTPLIDISISGLPIGNKTFTANWSVINYTITYNLDGGTNNPNNPSTYTIKTETFALGSPTKSAYNFIGWTSEDYNNPQINISVSK